MNIVLINNLYVEESLLINLKNKLFSSGHNFTYYLNNASDNNEIIERIKEAEVLIIDNHKISNEVLLKANKLKYIIVAFTGFDHIDINFCKEHHINISNCSGYATEAVAELTVGLIISELRKFIKFDSLVRRGLDKQDILGEEVQNKTIGLIGYGKIGRQVAKLLQNFDVQILVYSHHTINDLSKNIKQVDLNTLLKESHIVSIHTPLNDKTKRLISEKELSLMKKDSILINTARGPIVEQVALYNALKNHFIAGACLDVYDLEPPLKNNPFIELDNVILLPHVGYFTKEAMQKRFDIVEENLNSYLFESKIINQII